MLTPERIRFARTVFGAGDFGGWKRDVSFKSMKVWKHASGQVVVLEPGARGMPATLRILVEDGNEDALTVVADCKVTTWMRAITILHAFMLVPAHCTAAYDHAQRAVVLRIREAISHV